MVTREHREGVRCGNPLDWRDASQRLVGQPEYYSRINAGVILAKRALGTPGISYLLEGGPFLNVLERRVLGTVSPDGKS